MGDATNRFTQTVENYIKYRPSYPNEIIQLLIHECGLTKNKILADIGSGTGLLTKLFLDYGTTVYGVEPNEAMRTAGEVFLQRYPQFHSINGTAEATTLNDNSIDIITVGTAFHWFDAEKTKIEFKRILKSPGWVTLIWNVRNKEQSPFMQAYEEIILKYGTDYKDSRAEKFDKLIVNSFFAPFEMKTAAFENLQEFDWTGLKGRLLSTSYSLHPGDAHYEEMIQALKELFDKYQKNDKVIFLYSTKVHYGRLS